MPRSALLDETASVQWPTGLPAPDDKLRLVPTVAMILDEARPASLTKGRQLTLGALKVALIRDIIDESFERAYDRLGKLTGRCFPSGVSVPEREAGERKPLARASR